MTHQFDIFQAEKDGALLWRGTAANLDEARTLIGKLAVTTPGKYLALNLQSGERVEMDGQAAGSKLT